MRGSKTYVQRSRKLLFPMSPSIISPARIIFPPLFLWTASTPRPGQRRRSGPTAGRPPWPSSPPRPWAWEAMPLRTNPLQWCTCLCANQPQPLYRKGLASPGNGGPQSLHQVPPVPATPDPLATRAFWWARGMVCLHLPPGWTRHGRRTSRHSSLMFSWCSVLWQKRRCVSLHLLSAHINPPHPSLLRVPLSPSLINVMIRRRASASGASGKARYPGGPRGAAQSPRS